MRTSSAAPRRASAWWRKATSSVGIAFRAGRRSTTRRGSTERLGAELRDSSGPASHAELVVHVLEVLADGAHLDDQGIRDLNVRKAPGHQGHHVALAWGQMSRRVPVERRGPGLKLAAKHRGAVQPSEMRAKQLQQLLLPGPEIALVGEAERGEPGAGGIEIELELVGCPVVAIVAVEPGGSPLAAAEYVRQDRGGPAVGSLVPQKLDGPGTVPPLTGRRVGDPVAVRRACDVSVHRACSPMGL